MSLCVELAVPLATDKLEGPSTSLSFLGIILPYGDMATIRQPSKNTTIAERVAFKEQATDIVTGGHSSTCLKSCTTGKNLVSRMYATVAKMHYATRLSRALRSDIF